jgi:mono/diheme cytochrome c family protein
MGRGWRPILIGSAVAVATYALAQTQVFAPSVPTGAAAAGDFYSGETVFQRECAGCHGDGGKGGGIGPALFETGLDATEVVAAVQQGRGVMPAGIVSGQEQADVVAYVVAVSSPSE